MEGGDWKEEDWRVEERGGGGRLEGGGRRLDRSELQKRYTNIILC